MPSQAQYAVANTKDYIHILSSSLRARNFGSLVIIIIIFFKRRQFQRAIRDSLANTQQCFCFQRCCCIFLQESIHMQMSNISTFSINSVRITLNYLNCENKHVWKEQKTNVERSMLHVYSSASVHPNLFCS